LKEDDRQHYKILGLASFHDAVDKRDLLTWIDKSIKTLTQSNSNRTPAGSYDHGRSNGQRIALLDLKEEIEGSG